MKKRVIVSMVFGIGGWGKWWVKMIENSKCSEKVFGGGDVLVDIIKVIGVGIVFGVVVFGM